MLTLEAIFKDYTYDPREPGQIRWLEDGSGYTALETVEEYRDVEPERDEEGEWTQLYLYSLMTDYFEANLND